MKRRRVKMFGMKFEETETRGKRFLIDIYILLSKIAELLKSNVLSAINETFYLLPLSKT